MFGKIIGNWLESAFDKTLYQMVEDYTVDTVIAHPTGSLLLLNELSNRLKNADKTIAEYKPGARIKKLEKQVHDLEEEIHGLQNENSDLESQVSSLEEELEAAKEGN
jgi:predicted RNase H-like nuclease (RuvC/YqgF family)